MNQANLVLDWIKVTVVYVYIVLWTAKMTVVHFRAVRRLCNIVLELTPSLYRRVILDHHRLTNLIMLCMLLFGLRICCSAYVHILVWTLIIIAIVQMIKVLALLNETFHLMWYICIKGSLKLLHLAGAISLQKQEEKDNFSYYLNQCSYWFVTSYLIASSIKVNNFLIFTKRLK